MDTQGWSWGRAVRFIERDMWERDIAEFRPMARPLVSILRTLVLVARGFSQHQLSMRASALTYITVFSLVPTLAVGFAMFKAFGGLQSAQSVLLPKIMDYLAVGVRGQAEARIAQFLSNIHSGAIGAIGTLFLIAAVISLLSSMEDVFNTIWGVQRSRSYFQQIAVYWTMITITPLLLLVGVSLPALFARIGPLQKLLEWTRTAHAFFSMFLPLLLVCGAFTLMYAFMTHTRVPLKAALVGGITGGSLWLGAAYGYAWYAKTTVYYSSIYGSLSAIPIFLFWIYLSWLIVFSGAEVAFASQHLSTYRDAVLTPHPSQAESELLALRILVETCRRFQDRRTPATREALAHSLGVPRQLVHAAVSHLLAIGLLLESDRHGLIPASDPTTIFPAEVLQRLRQRGDPVSWLQDDALMAVLRQRRVEEDDASRRVWNIGNVAQLDGPDASVDAAAGARNDDPS